MVFFHMDTHQSLVIRSFSASSAGRSKICVCAPIQNKIRVDCYHCSLIVYGTIVVLSGVGNCKSNDNCVSYQWQLSISKMLGKVCEQYTRLKSSECRVVFHLLQIEKLYSMACFFSYVSFKYFDTFLQSPQNVYNFLGSISEISQPSSL